MTERLSSNGQGKKCFQLYLDSALVKVFLFWFGVFFLGQLQIL